MQHDLDAINAAIALGDLAWAPVGSKFIWKSPWGDCSAEVVTVEKWVNWCGNASMIKCEVTGSWGTNKVICDYPPTTLISLPEDWPPFADWLRGEGLPF